MDFIITIIDQYRKPIRYESCEFVFLSLKQKLVMLKELVIKYKCLQGSHDVKFLRVGS